MGVTWWSVTFAHVPYAPSASPISFQKAANLNALIASCLTMLVVGMTPSPTLCVLLSLCYNSPHCSIFQGDLSRPDIPLTVTGTYSQREFMPVCSSAPLLILTIKLATMSCDGLPPNIVYQNLYPYLLTDVKHIVLSFDFSTPSGINTYMQEVSKLVECLNSGNLIRYFHVYLEFFRCSCVQLGSVALLFFWLTIRIRCEEIFILPLTTWVPLL
jgi:hypothetical protein